MFVQHSTTVDLGISEIERELNEIRSHADEWADVAYRQGEQLRARVGPGDSLARSVSLQIGMPELHSFGIVYPITWTATGATLLFPELKADLILAKRGTGRTEITLKGTYEPPLGSLGRLADRAGLGRVADATVKHWMGQLSEALTNPESRSE